MSWDWLSRLEDLRRRGVPVTMITVARVEGSAPREAGAKMLVLEDGNFFGTIGGGRLEQLAIDEGKRILTEAGAAKSVRYPLGARAGQCCGGVVELLFEPIAPGPELWVFGVGHVGQALCRTLAGTPFRVHAVDERPEWIASKELPADVERHDEDWDTVVRNATWSAERSYAIVMTHRHDVDEAIVAGLLRRPFRWVGLIGSDSKWARFRMRLDARGFTAAELSQVRCPVGLALGGRAPQEIAISIAAELLSVHYGHTETLLVPAGASLRGPVVADGSA